MWQWCFEKKKELIMVLELATFHVLMINGFISY